MAKYSDIKGFTVQTLSSDPAASQAAGGSWASGGNINNASLWFWTSRNFKLQDQYFTAGGYVPTARVIL